MRLMVTGNMNPYEIEALMDEEIATFEEESEVPAAGLSTMARFITRIWYCGRGYGVVNALGAADRPAGEMGHLLVTQW